jgi:hypothetical protein
MSGDATEELVGRNRIAPSAGTARKDGARTQRKAPADPPAGAVLLVEKSQAVTGLPLAAGLGTTTSSGFVAKKSSKTSAARTTSAAISRA